MPIDPEKQSSAASPLSMSTLIDLIHYIGETGGTEELKRLCAQNKLYATFDPALASKLTAHLAEARAHDPGRFAVADEQPGVDDRSKEGGWSKGMHVIQKE